MAQKKRDEQAIKIKELGSAMIQIAEEKGITKDKVVEIVEKALAAAYKKDYGKKSQNIRASFNEETGVAKFFLVKEAVDETTRRFVTEEEENIEVVKDEKTKEKEKEKEAEEIPGEERLPRFNLERDIPFLEAKKIKKSVKLGDILETELETKTEFGRVAAQTAKQVIIQRVREAERESMFEEYKKKEGEVISGTVQRVEGRNVFIDIGKSTGVLFPSEQISQENYRIGQHIKAYIVKVELDPKGPGILLSRARPEMLEKLFELEVPEIFSGAVEIKGVAREAGARSKIAVLSKEEGIDPIGSCVGQKGTRVQAVIDELGGEKIDIIEWNDNPAKFISFSLSPAKVVSIETDEEKKEALVKVSNDQLSLAIGKKGQNVRLAAKLTGWKINVKGEEEDIENVEDVESDKNIESAGKDKSVEGDKDEKTKEGNVTI